MALRWENPASTTHSLTPSPSNRPLIFWILTPRKKPEATGSAGRCEPGVGRFTDPHPLTCSFFTPLSTAWFRGICYERWRNFVMACRPAFSSLTRTQGVLQAAAFGNCCSKRLTLAQQGLSGALLVSFSYPGPKTSHRATQSRVSFFAPKTSLPLPLKGEGLAIVFLGVVEFALLVYNRLTRLQQGLFRASLVSFPYSASKTAHRATRSRVWLSPLFPRTFLLWQGC